MKCSVKVDGFSITIEKDKGKEDISKPRKVPLQKNKKQEFILVSVNVKDWFKGLSLTARGLLFTMQFYCDWNDNCIRFDNKPLGIIQIMEVANIKSRTTGARAISELVARNLICVTGRGKSKRLFLNPWVFRKGSEPDKHTMGLFITQLAKLQKPDSRADPVFFTIIE
jgi:hypothetical protein